MNEEAFVVPCCLINIEHRQGKAIGWHIGNKDFKGLFDLSINWTSEEIAPLKE